MKSSIFLNGTLTAFFTMALFAVGVGTTQAISINPKPICPVEAPSFDTPRKNMPFSNEVTILCSYNSKAMSHDFLARGDTKNTNIGVNWEDYGLIVELAGVTPSTLGGDQLNASIIKTLEATLFMNRMIWGEINKPLSNGKTFFIPL